MTLRNRSIVAITAIVAIGLCSLWRSEPNAPAPADTTPPQLPSPPTSAAADTSDVERQDATGTPNAASAARFDEIPAHAGLVRTRVLGLVLDAAGTSVAGVEVRRVTAMGRMADAGASVPAQTLGSVLADGAGRFAIEGVPPFSLEVHDDRYTTICQGIAARSATREVVIVVAPRIPLGGLVVDRDDSPIVGATVTFLAKVGRVGHDLSTSRMLSPTRWWSRTRPRSR